MTADSQRLGKYRILEELGEGGFATVYKAVDTTLDREVALKILHPPLLTDRRFVQNFRMEAKTLAALRHPQIITVYEVGEVEGRLFIAMDLAHGPSLAQSIAKRGRIPWDEMLALLKPVCEALDYAHGQKVIHRDLKPANLLLDTQRGALLTDFGFARLMAENTMSMSMSGGIVGTPGYIAPEVWEDNAASPPVDIYALGCIAYEMLTGDVLFKGQTPIQAMRAHDRGPQFPETWSEGVPTNIASVLNKALARDPAARYPSAGALWHALNDLETQAQAAREEAQRAEAAKQAAARREEEAKREAAQRAALAAEWRAEAERALAENNVSAAKMALGRWRAVSPGDAAIREIQTKLERLTAPPPVEAQPSSPPQSKPAAQDRVRADLRERTTGPAHVPPVEAKTPAKAPPTRATQLESSPRVGHTEQIVGGAIGLIVVLILILVGIVIRNNRPAAALLPAWAPELVPVPSGDFLMGSKDSDSLAYDTEKPQHTLNLPTYWIGKTEVTNAQFRPFVEGDGYTNQAYWTQAGWQWRQSEKITKPLYWDDSQWNGDNFPVVGVSWYEAVAYCHWLSAQTGQEFRLPSEAEWEKAARGTDGRIWPWGDVWEADRANSKEAGPGKTTPVGQYPAGAGPYGALDMAGNVLEWCATKWSKPYPYQIEDEWQAAYLAANDYPVVRGGSWAEEQKHVRASLRAGSPPRNRDYDRGLRVASHSRPGSGY